MLSVTNLLIFELDLKAHEPITSLFNCDVEIIFD